MEAEMERRAKATLLISCVALASCSAGNGIKIRAAADPVVLSKGDAISVARAQLMLGNVGLALEGFRKALRDNPSDTVALAGIGDCYASMNRYDLAQSSYEQALALLPRDPSLLRGIARIFDQEGQHEKATLAQAEAAAAIAQQAPLQRPVIASIPAGRPVPLNTAAVGSVTVELPTATPAQRVAEPVIEAARRTIVPAATENTSRPQQVGSPASPISATDGHLAALSSPLPVARAEEPRSRRVAQSPAATQDVALLLSEADPASGQIPPTHTNLGSMDAIAPPPPQPRLERLSGGEVALITTSTPIWRQPSYRRPSAETKVAWVRLMPTPPGTNVQILNAAREEGLAASARSLLVSRGWRKIAVGDAPALQHRSVVLYPASQTRIGRSLAAQFGIRSRVVKGKAVVLILGRDSVSRIGGRRTA
jgi:hypothetical protein